MKQKILDAVWAATVVLACTSLGFLGAVWFIPPQKVIETRYQEVIKEVPVEVIKEVPQRVVIEVPRLVYKDLRPFKSVTEFKEITSKYNQALVFFGRDCVDLAEALTQVVREFEGILLETEVLENRNHMVVKAIIHSMDRREIWYFDPVNGRSWRAYWEYEGTLYPELNITGTGGGYVPSSGGDNGEDNDGDEPDWGKGGNPNKPPKKK